MKTAFHEISGIEIMRAVSRPISAGIAHRLGDLYGEIMVLVFHLGGGVSEVSLFNLDDGVFELVEAVSQGEEASHGSLVEWVTKRCTELSGQPIVLDSLTVKQLIFAVDKALVDSALGGTIGVPVQRCIDGKDPAFIRFTRAQLDDLSVQAIGGVIERADDLLERNGFSHNDISRVSLRVEIYFLH